MKLVVTVDVDRLPDLNFEDGQSVLEAPVLDWSRRLAAVASEVGRSWSIDLIVGDDRDQRLASGIGRMP